MNNSESHFLFNENNHCTNPKVILKTRSFKLTVAEQNGLFYRGININFNDCGMGAGCNLTDTPFNSEQEAITDGYQRMVRYTENSTKRPEYMKELVTAYAQLFQTSLF